MTEVLCYQLSHTYSTMHVNITFIFLFEGWNESYTSSSTGQSFFQAQLR